MRAHAALSATTRPEPVLPSERPTPTASAPGPYLSIVLTGRNDGYGGDFVERFFRTLRFNLQQLGARGVTHELVFIEWAPPPDRPLLVDRIFDEVPELDPARCLWFVVDPQYHHTLSQNPRLEYLEFPAKNIGIRRARGQFILTSNCDVFFGRCVLDALEGRTLRPRSLYRAPRHDINLPDGCTTIDWTVLEDATILAGPAHRLKPPFMGSATGDFVMLDRQSFHEMRGFNEVYRVARIGIDRNVLVKALSLGFEIRDIGGPVYHVNHEGSYRLDPDAYAGREHEAPWGDRRWHSGGVSYVNSETWGLAEAPIRPGLRCVYLDFDWSAVPPLVDLRGVVLPVSRVGHPTPGQYVRKK
jgi:hypothetical protein